MYSTQLAPGEIGRQQLRHGRVPAGFVQPVRLAGPAGTSISPAEAGSFYQDHASPAGFGLQVGRIYRFRLSQIPLLDGVELFPSVEMIGHLHPPEGQSWNFPVPIVFAIEDLRIAAEGGMVTRVIYVEDPDAALLGMEDWNEQTYFEVRSGADPLHIAEDMGRPIAILRMGSKTPDGNTPDHRFTFRSPPIERSPISPRITRRPQYEGARRQAVRHVDFAMPIQRDPSSFCSENSFQIGDISISRSNSGPLWAHEPPSIDLFDTRYQVSSTAYSPSRTNVAYSVGNTTSCESGGYIANADGMTDWDAAHGGRRSPRDEHVHDGGDRRTKTRVSSNWRVDGLDTEDTIAHFDTLAGETEVVASNRTRIYAPRFAATRKVQRVLQNRTQMIPTRATIVDRVVEQDIRSKSGTIKQPMATVRAVGTSIGTTVEEHQRGLTVNDVDIPVDWQGMLLPYESLAIITRGVFEVDQQESVIEAANAAQVWSSVQFAQATVLGMVPSIQRSAAQAEAAVIYEMPEGKARLRLVKLASESVAQAGDVIHFTLRFDNVGDEPIGNVTIIDNLTMRLEYVDESEECSREASFITDDASADTLALRWEITDPLKPGEGGVIRFQCRLR